MAFASPIQGVQNNPPLTLTFKRLRVYKCAQAHVVGVIFLRHTVVRVSVPHPQIGVVGNKSRTINVPQLWGTSF